MRAEDVFLRILSVILTGCALFGAFIAWITFALLCETSDAGCGNARGIMTTQLVVGVIGLSAPAAMVYFSFTGSNRRALGALVVGLGVWAAWAVLNDAAVHGWGHDMVLLGPFD